MFFGFGERGEPLGSPSLVPLPRDPKMADTARRDGGEPDDDDG